MLAVATSRSYALNIAYCAATASSSGVTAQGGEKNVISLTTVLYHVVSSSTVVLSFSVKTASASEGSSVKMLMTGACELLLSIVMPSSESLCSPRSSLSPEAKTTRAFSIYTMCLWGQ